jgi:DNA-binding transcriptional ArsR family regulator
MSDATDASDDATEPRSTNPAHPLDHILGTVATVRVLRELAQGGEYAPPHLAVKTNTSRPAVREALIRLTANGIVEHVGQGRNLLYRLVDDHPLARRIIKLFRAEEKEYARS